MLKPVVLLQYAHAQSRYDIWDTDILDQWLAASD